MEKFRKKLNDYARLCIRVGINLQPNQPLVITAPIEGLEFVRLLAKEAYEVGARDIHVHWKDEELTKMKFKYAPMEIFENFPQWRIDSLEEYAKQGAGFISILAEDPYLLQGMDSRKIAIDNKSTAMALNNFNNYIMNNTNSWCVISIATQSWANKVFPNLNEEDAYKELWKAIFKSTYMDLSDPIATWKEHIMSLEKRIEFLNQKNFKSLHYISSNGTDLVVELPKNHIWAGGDGINSKNISFVPNIPTEEIFTVLLRTGVNGTVHSTKPLNYKGNLIEDFTLVFENGQVVDFQAKTGYNALKAILDTDENSRFLGEIALVPFNSPISELNIVFLNTLFDENASCHFALGKSYPRNILNGENMSQEELQMAGANNSLIHVDFMVGSSDMNIRGKTYFEEEIDIFKNGNWAFRI